MMNEIQNFLDSTGFDLENYKFVATLNPKEIAYNLEIRRIFLIDEDLFSKNELRPFVFDLMSNPIRKNFDNGDCVELNQPIIELKQRNDSFLNKLADNKVVYVDQIEKLHSSRITISIDPMASEEQILRFITKRLQRCKQQKKIGSKKTLKYESFYKKSVRKIIDDDIFPYMDLMILEKFIKPIKGEDKASILNFEHHTSTHSRKKEFILQSLDPCFLRALEINQNK